MVVHDLIRLRPNLRPRSFRLRMFAVLLLESVLALTCAPVCGSPLDVDSGQCCRRHGCDRSKANNARVLSAAGSVKRPACCHTHPDGLGSSHNSEECCKRGRLSYPVAKIQAHGSASPVTATVLGVIPSATAILLATGSGERARALQESPPLRNRGTPLYTLNSSYRI